MKIADLVEILRLAGQVRTSDEARRFKRRVEEIVGPVPFPASRAYPSDLWRADMRGLLYCLSSARAR
jgi:hypothetical protein